MQTTKYAKETTPNTIKTKEKLQLEKKQGKQHVIGYPPSSPISNLNTLMQKYQNLQGKYAYSRCVYHVDSVTKVSPNIFSRQKERVILLIRLLKQLQGKLLIQKTNTLHKLLVQHKLSKNHKILLFLNIPKLLVMIEKIKNLQNQLTKIPIPILPLLILIPNTTR